ncbi:MAG: PGPGW domain-containing protein [Actinomycetota bacterium]
MADHERESLRDAAIQAEYETGAREETEAEARSHIVVRIARMTIGSIVCLAGVAMLVLPGPGLVVIAAGLAILARDVAWADRLVGHVRDRIPADEQGNIPRSTIVTMIVAGIAGVLLSVWWIAFR